MHFNLTHQCLCIWDPISVAHDNGFAFRAPRVFSSALGRSRPAKGLAKGLAFQEVIALRCEDAGVGQRLGVRRVVRVEGTSGRAETLPLTQRLVGDVQQGLYHVLGVSLVREASY